MTLLNQEQIKELQRDPSKYKSPVRQVPRVIPQRFKRQQSALRSSQVEITFGHPMEQGEDIIVIDDEEIVPEEMTMATLAQIGSISGSFHDRSKNLSIRSISKRHRSKAKNSRSTAAIMIVDLCSSDEEDNANMRISTDENKDPMDCLEPETSFSRSFSSSKLRPKPCIYPADSTNNRFAGNNLTADKDNRGNKCLGDVLKHSCTGFTPLLSQTP